MHRERSHFSQRAQAFFKQPGLQLLQNFEHTDCLDRIFDSEPDEAENQSNITWTHHYDQQPAVRRCVTVSH